MDGSSVQATAGDLPSRPIHIEIGSTTVYEGLSVTDIANHSGLWLEKNKWDTANKGICVRNGFKPYYLLPRQQL